MCERLVLCAKALHDTLSICCLTIIRYFLIFHKNSEYPRFWSLIHYFYSSLFCIFFNVSKKNPLNSNIHPKIISGMKKLSEKFIILMAFFFLDWYFEIGDIWRLSDWFGLIETRINKSLLDTQRCGFGIFTIREVDELYVQTQKPSKCR